MVNKKSSPKKKKKRYTFQLTLSSILLLSICLVFILAWIFSLGIMVGRGFLPRAIEGFSSIKEKVANDEEEEKVEIDHPGPIGEEELTFYNRLISKKEETKKGARSSHVLKDQGKKAKVEQLKEEISGYSVQVAALKGKGKAEKMVERLVRLGYPAYYYQTLINDVIYYRIRCGPFQKIEEANKSAKRLTDKEGFKPFIIYPTIK
jgi:cell division protein FtsN